MANIDKNKLTKEQVEKAMSCESVDELITLAREEGFELTKEEAEAYMEELSDFELDEDTLQEIAGGNCYYLCPDHKCDY